MFKFDKNGTQIKVVKPAVKNPELWRIAVSADQIIVADFTNHQLLSFTRDLEFVKNGILHTLGINDELKKWRLGEASIFENCNIVEMRLRKWSGFMCK